ncbi:hypothetical protein CHARACLAT_020408 [Characodon lateralis]|uniref:Uncharacterized protein n=1 Tax=Characodon lateralis TaxID=208331 RepID=A0ABU7F6Q9_9TELE|nr:hypothetical protein [Characodon lateralis]
MLSQAPKPRRSSRESPFHTKLHPSCSRASSWEHLTLAHLPVHPPKPPTRTQRRYPRNTSGTKESHHSVPHSLPTLATVEKTYCSPASLQPRHPYTS